MAEKQYPSYDLNAYLQSSADEVESWISARLGNARRSNLNTSANGIIFSGVEPNAFAPHASLYFHPLDSY